MGDHLGDEIQCQEMLSDEHNPSSQTSYSQLQFK